MELDVLVHHFIPIESDKFDLLEDDILVFGRPRSTFTKTSVNQGKNQDGVDVHDDAKQLKNLGETRVS